MIPALVPALGILEGDAPSANMLVVLYEGESGHRWAYVTPGHNRHRSYDVTHPESFTLLSRFGVHAMMTPDGHLAIHQLDTISIATYRDGKARHWQGAAAAKVQINPRICSYVVEAIRKDFDSRRADQVQSVA